MTEPAIGAKLSEASTARPHLLLAIIIALGFFCYLAGEARRADFSSSSENVVVQAAIEIRRGGPVWVPNMHGRPRMTKPPLATWITAAAISEHTMARLDSADPAMREAAYRQLAWEVRWPAALCSSVTLLGVYVLAAMLLGPTVGIMSMLIAATSLLTFRYGRMATTDVQLTLWVTWANVSLAAALVLQKRWYLALAGVFMGLGVMSKGPVALVQSALPAIVFAAYLRSRPAIKPLLAPAIAAVALMLAVALPWPVSIFVRTEGIVEHWFREITRVGATELEPDPWWGYWKLIPNMMPWAPLFVAGLCVPLFARLRSRGAMYAWFMFAVPLAVMSFASDKPDRYGLPLVVPGAILSAHVASVLVQTRGRWAASDRLVVILQWAILLIAPLAVLVAAIAFIDKLGVPRWAAVLAGATSLVIAIAASLLAKRRPWALIVGTALAALPIFSLVGAAYAASPNGQSESKPIAAQVYQRHADFRAYYYDPRERKRHIHTDLGVYLSRPVIHIQDVGEIPSASSTALVFMLQRHDEPMPVCPGGELEFTADIDKQWLHVFRVDR